MAKVLIPISIVVVMGLSLAGGYLQKGKAQIYNKLKCGNGVCEDFERSGLGSCSKDCDSGSSKKEVGGKNSPFGFHPSAVLGVKNPFEYATDIGVKWDRPSLYFFWILVQPDLKGGYDWGQHDKYYKALPSSINAMANLAIGHPLKNKNYTDYAKGEKSYLPKDEVAYRKFVMATVERYDGDGKSDMPGLKNPIKYWQVENEPPHGLSDYAQFLKITYEAVKKADPEAKVIIGGVPGMPPVSSYIDSFDKFYLPILEDLAKMKGRYFDIFDFHWYGNASGDYRDMKIAKSHIEKKLNSLGIKYDEIWMTEMGTYSGDPKEFPQLGGDYPYQSEKQQASDLVKRYVYPLSLGVKKVFLAFGLIEGFRNDGGYFDFTGLIYDGKYEKDLGRGVKKLSYYSYKKMAEMLDGSDWSSMKIIQEKDGVYVYKVFKNGKPTWIAWNDNKDVKEVIISGINAKQVRIIEAVPNHELGKDVTDYNKAFKTGVREVKNGQISITLGDVPVFIE